MCLKSIVDIFKNKNWITLNCFFFFFFLTICFTLLFLKVAYHVNPDGQRKQEGSSSYILRQVSQIEIFK